MFMALVLHLYGNLHNIPIFADTDNRSDIQLSSNLYLLVHISNLSLHTLTSLQQFCHHHG